MVQGDACLGVGEGSVFGGFFEDVNDEPQQNISNYFAICQLVLPLETQKTTDSSTSASRWDSSFPNSWTRCSAENGQEKRTEKF